MLALPVAVAALDVYRAKGLVFREAFGGVAEDGSRGSPAVNECLHAAQDIPVGYRTIRAARYCNACV